MVTAPTYPTVAPITARHSPLPAALPRLVSVDVLRGLVMVIMALDHTRDFLTYQRSAPEDLAHTTGALFFTRVITHYCAPVFAFLAGTGAFLASSRGKSLQQVSRFFLTRGLWLVLLELTVVDFAWGFVPWAHGGVIWILGWSMVAMALIVWLPVRRFHVGTSSKKLTPDAGYTTATDSRVDQLPTAFLLPCGRSPYMQC